MSKTFHAAVSREDGFWIAEVAGVGATESRRLAALETEVRDLIAGMRDVDEDSFALDFDYTQAFAPAAGKSLESFFASRADLAAAETRFEIERYAVACELRADGVSLRDAAVLLGISFQRVQQLVSGPVPA